MSQPANATFETRLHPPKLDLRACGSCTLCCRLPEIDHFAKPANTWCPNCTAGRGCSIYADRPQLCRDFLCAWMMNESLGPEWEPSVANMMVYGQGQQITVLVDPDYPNAWKTEPYTKQLNDWACEARRKGGYIIVFVGDDVFKINPS